MKYLRLVYLEETTLNALPRNERLSLSGESMAYCDELQKNGQFIAASPLHPVETATTRSSPQWEGLDHRRTLCRDEEQLGGYFLIDVRDLNDAILVASKIQAARLRSIEVRPVNDGGCAE